MATHCDGCGIELTAVDRAGNWTVCFDCTKARARSFGNGRRCVCGRKRARPRVVRQFPRVWESCDRCLGTIRQLPDDKRGG
jgi:hypothetical protein